jgi:hypothetical protein
MMQRYVATKLREISFTRDCLKQTWLKRIRQTRSLPSRSTRILKAIQHKTARSPSTLLFSQLRPYSTVSNDKRLVEMYSTDFWPFEDAFRDLSLTLETNTSPLMGGESDDDGGCPSASLDAKLRSKCIDPIGAFRRVLTESGKRILTPNIIQSAWFNFTSSGAWRRPSIKVISAFGHRECHERDHEALYYIAR